MRKPRLGQPGFPDQQYCIVFQACNFCSLIKHSKKEKRKPVLTLLKKDYTDLFYYSDSGGCLIPEAIFIVSTIYCNVKSNEPKEIIK